MALVFVGFAIATLGSIMSSGRNPVGFRIAAVFIMLAGVSVIILGAQV